MPFMDIRDPAAAVEFHRAVFGARVLMREADPDGVVSHAQFQIGESRFMISNPACDDVSECARSGWARTPQELGGTRCICTCGSRMRTACSAQPWLRAQSRSRTARHGMGDRIGGFQDPWGHIWYVAT
jgi:PhnB protein